MTPKLNHPFMEGLKVVPKGRTRELEKIKNWMSSQPHLPEISDQYLYLFLHACYWVHDKTKSAIENYFSVRSNYPAIFGDRDHQSPRMSLIFDDLG
ncbi:hypothetical protein JTB14_011939 [Gonioctena quinquepunctata]|nr:hypothetical protein JTB14_011939 [Gonioctena quinquepunctata]